MLAAKRHKPEHQYLHSINRDLLSFDAEKVCLVTLSNINVYCCLSCGKYLQGRNDSSPAYIHSVEKNHNVFINLNSLQVYLLPDGTPVDSNSSTTISQIQANIDPTYLKPLSTHFSTHKEGRTLHYKSYIPGYIPIDTSSTSSSSSISCALQLIAHTEPIRDWFLLHKHGKSTILTAFSLFIRRLWYHELFRAHISPSVLLKCLEPRLTATNSTTPKSVLAILFNVLHSELTKESGKGKSVVSKAFQGKLEVTTTVQTTVQPTEMNLDAMEKKDQVTGKTHLKGQTRQIQKFWMLPVDFVDTSTIKSDHINERITQVSFKSLLKRYDGQTQTHINENTIKTQQISSLPPYLVFFIDRKLSLRNPTVVKFDLEMDFAPYCVSNGVAGSTKYRLVGHVKHKLQPGTKLDSGDDSHDWEVLLERGIEWYSIGESVKSCNKELLFLEESSILVWKQE